MFETALLRTVVTISSRSRLITGRLSFHGNWIDSDGRVVAGSDDVLTGLQCRRDRYRDDRREDTEACLRIGRRVGGGHAETARSAMPSDAGPRR